MSEQLANASAVAEMVQDLAEQIHRSSDKQVALVGIHTGGVPIAKRIAAAVQALGGAEPLLGETDITLYRDDLYTGLENPSLGVTRLPFSVDGARIILVDDVLFTGRTVRAAVDLIMDYGRPAYIKLAVLVDRVSSTTLGWGSSLQPDNVAAAIESQAQAINILTIRIRLISSNSSRTFPVTSP